MVKPAWSHFTAAPGGGEVWADRGDKSGCAARPG